MLCILQLFQILKYCSIILGKCVDNHERFFALELYLSGNSVILVLRFGLMTTQVTQIAPNGSIF